MGRMYQRKARKTRLIGISKDEVDCAAILEGRALLKMRLEV
jgi:hypothetical protein